LSGVTYPNGETTTFAPNALGQASQVGSLINTTTWHPNGQNAGFNFGNGIVRTLTQTSRKLPDRLKDQGAALVFDEDLTYDQNANVTQITDVRDTSLNRTLIYDAQDRLTSAQGLWGAGSMTYDGADNLKTQTIGAKNYTYSYTNEKLQTISDPNQTLISFGYDNRGNQTQKNGQALIWDQASRIARINGKAQYQYDGHGRRLLNQKLNAANQPTGNTTLQIYGKEGQLLYEEQIGANPTGSDVIFANGFEPVSTTITTYHYLDKTMIARKETRNGNTAAIYLHTDVLGSIVAETDESQFVLKRTHYQPFGLPNVPNSGPGYTGHVMDADTSLIYMQARYLDPDVGRFISMDPKAPSAIDGTDFNRYAYARNNPCLYVDPDGRAGKVAWLVRLTSDGMKKVARLNLRMAKKAFRTIRPMARLGTPFGGARA
jgi:RHS repeat-associated protein